ncbi:MAG: outer membrane protein assembly factor BamC [Burkholderiales bacterium]
MRRSSAVLLGALLLAGCSSSGSFDNKVEYKSASTLPPLEVPPDLTTPKEDNRYVLPETADKATTLSGYQSGRTQQTSVGDSKVLPQMPNMHVERDGDERWLVVANDPPEKLWGLVKDFWQENGFLIKTDRPEAGVMETDWAENRAKVPQGGLSKFIASLYSTSERDKFRTRMERTPDGKGTEIYISHRGMEEVISNQQNSSTVWQPRPTDPGLEAEFLRRLMVRLGTTEQVAKQQVAVSAPAQRAVLKPGPGGVEQLEVSEPFDRTWRRVGLALDRVGFTVEDRDRNKGLYFVRYADPEAEMKDSSKGFFSKLFSSSGSKVKAEQYRVAIKDQNDTSMVQVLDKDGATDKTETARRILALLHEQLK